MYIIQYIYARVAVYICMIFHYIYTLTQTKIIGAIWLAYRTAVLIPTLMYICIYCTIDIYVSNIRHHLCNNFSTIAYIVNH